jgi:hypothetical protein
VGKHERAEAFSAYLAGEGYQSQADGRGDLWFLSGGLKHCLVLDPDDEAYVRLLVPNIWRAKDDAERREAYEAANEATARTKVAKVWVADDGLVSVSLEMFVRSAADATATFRRSLDALSTAVTLFTEKMRE